MRLRESVCVAASFALTGLVPSVAQAQPVEWRLLEPFGVFQPRPRSMHGMAYDAVRGVTVLFGGYAPVIRGDTWEWNGTVWTQRLVSGPAARVWPSMSYDSARGVTVLFGGSTNSGEANGETWEWDGTDWSQRLVSGPTPRRKHATAYDSARAVTVLFGGEFTDSTAPVGDTWEWNGTAWFRHAVAGPSARREHAMAYDSARQTTVLFGGFNINPPDANGETWEWNGTVWTQRAVIGPSPRYGHAMTYDSARGVVVLFSGDSLDGGSDTWEWDGTRWMVRPIAGPPPMAGHGLVYDSGRGVAVLFGAAEDSGRATWELRATCDGPTILTQPSDQVGGVDAAVSFFVEAESTPGCTTGLTYQWQRRDPVVADPFAANAWLDLNDGGGFVNTHTSALFITHPIPALATGYRCRIGGGCGCGPEPSASTYTQTVNFSVACPADFNGDGGVDGQDVEAFFARWEAGC